MASDLDVHRASTTRRERLPPVRRPPSVHRPFERERIEERDGVLVAVDREMTVVEVDHRDARAHESRESEHWHAGTEREGGVGVA